MNFDSISTLQLSIIIALGIWDLCWRGIALWRSAQAKQNAWFVALLIVNSIGILPIVYLLVHRTDTSSTS